VEISCWWRSTKSDDLSFFDHHCIDAATASCDQQIALPVKVDGKLGDFAS
jgi:hypothetical protein